MSVKKEEKKEEKVGKYFYAVGKRKTAIVQVRIYEMGKSDGEILVNGKKLKEYFPTVTLQSIVLAPFKASGMPNQANVTLLAKGGGLRAQAEASRLAISRALVIIDEKLRKSLKDLGYLTRDSRVVERKKPGLKKARRAPQWQKR